MAYSQAVIKDATPKVVEQFLKFIYTDTVDDTTFDTVSKLLHMAEEYNVHGLSLLCSQHLLQAMTEENVSDLAVFGQMYDLKVLKDKAVKFIANHPNEVMESDGWKDLLKHMPDLCNSVISKLASLNCDSANPKKKFKMN